MKLAVSWLRLICLGALLLSSFACGGKSEQTAAPATPPPAPASAPAAHQAAPADATKTQEAKPLGDDEDRGQDDEDASGKGPGNEEDPGRGPQ